MTAVAAVAGDIVVYGFTGDAGFAVIVACILATGLFYRWCCHIWLHWRLGRLTYGGTSKWLLTRYLIGHDIRKSVGNPLLLKWSQGLIAIIAAEILLFSYVRALYRGSGEFARGGALVVIAGLTCIILGYWVSERLRDRWAEIAIAAPDDLMEVGIASLSAIPRDKVQFHANMTAFAISLIGTLVWAYGDQALDCGLFPHLNWTNTTYLLPDMDRPEAVAKCGVPPTVHLH